MRTEDGRLELNEQFYGEAEVKICVGGLSSLEVRRDIGEQWEGKDEPMHWRLEAKPRQAILS